MSSPVVVNASPLIFLSHAGLIDLLRMERESVFVPQPVVAEIRRRGHYDPTVVTLNTTPWLEEVKPFTPAPRVQAWRLGPGETAVLSWALANSGSTAVVDDRAARRCAEALGISLIGTLGLVLRAKRRGYLPAARPAVDRLLAAGLYLSERVLSQALSLVGE